MQKWEKLFLIETELFTDLLVLQKEHRLGKRTKKNIKAAVIRLYKISGRNLL